MPELKLEVPTYYGKAFADEVEANQRLEFGSPHASVLVYTSTGVRIVLGSHDLRDALKPDIHIERRPRGWAIFLHPLGEGDPSGYIYFLDDGRSYLIPENGLGPTPAIEVLAPESVVAEVDFPPAI